MHLSEKRAKRAFFAVTGSALALLLLRGLTGAMPDFDLTIDRTLYLALEAAGGLACIARAIRRGRHRAAWVCIGVGVLSFTAGDVVWIVADGHLAYPSLADGFYIAFYPLCCAGVAILLARGREYVASRLWMDGAIGGLAVAAVAVALVFQTVVDATHGTSAQIAVNLAYPIGDLVLFGFALTAFATQGWRPGRGWALLGLGAALNAVADTAYLYQDARGIFHEGSLVDALWPAAMLCFGWASLNQWREAPLERRFGRSTVALPSVFSAMAIGVLVWAQFHHVSPLATVLATAALAATTVRTALTFRDNMRLLRETREKALTDNLTGLSNRARLMDDLARALELGAAGYSSTLAFFDLDGFKGYNDGFGHAAGDMLLERLASRLATAVDGRGRAYRLGGDEFCVLVDGAEAADGPVVGGCIAALCEQGEGFAVGVSHGVVVVPDETQSPTHALQLADQRMYWAKDASGASSRRQACDVLLQVLREREPDLHAHLHGVASLAVGVGRQLGIGGEQLDELLRAAELHDIGKLAVPDAILHKPAPLDTDEWELMRQHTIVGDRILSAAPAMRPVAQIVRSSHERYDGTGYPDRLRGEQIPLAARVIAVCDAYHAMTSDRAYKRTLDHPAALAELRRCADTQFDPAVVAALTAVMATPASTVPAGEAGVPLRTASAG